MEQQLINTNRNKKYYTEEKNVLEDSLRAHISKLSQQLIKQESQYHEERTLYTDNLKQIITKLSEENEQLYNKLNQMGYTESNNINTDENNQYDDEEEGCIVM